MGTPYKITLGPQDLGNFHRKAYDSVSAGKVSALLQRNLESNDIIFQGARHSKCPSRMLVLGPCIPNTEGLRLRQLIRSYRPLLADIVCAGRYARGDPEGIRPGVSIPKTKAAN
jgi:hypothetical protein